MARLFGVDLPREKRIEIGLTYIYGIGNTTAKKIIAETGVNPDIRVKDISEDDLQKIREYIDKNLTVEGDLHREVSQNIKRLMGLAATVASVTARVCPFVASAPTPMLAPARARVSKSAARRSRGLTHG